MSLVEPRKDRSPALWIGHPSTSGRVPEGDRWVTVANGLLSPVSDASDLRLSSWVPEGDRYSLDPHLSKTHMRAQGPPNKTSVTLVTRSAGTR